MRDINRNIMKRFYYLSSLHVTSVRQLAKIAMLPVEITKYLIQGWKKTNNRFLFTARCVARNTKMKRGKEIHRENRNFFN